MVSGICPVTSIVERTGVRHRGYREENLAVSQRPVFGGISP